MAPGASVVALKAGSELLPNSAILQAIDYAVTVDHVNVLNESFGPTSTPTTALATPSSSSTTGRRGRRHGDRLDGRRRDHQHDRQPGHRPEGDLGRRLDRQPALRADRVRPRRTVLQRPWQDNNISSLSSAGITQTARTIDVASPGEADWAVCDACGIHRLHVNFGNPATARPNPGLRRHEPVDRRSPPAWPRW